MELKVETGCDVRIGLLLERKFDIEGNRFATGLVGAAKDNYDKNGVVRLPLDQVFETRIEVNWDAIMKEGKNRQ